MSSFHERQKSLFNHLKDAEDQCSFSKTNKARPDQDPGTIDVRLYRQRRREMKQFKGKESIFKKPQDNIRNCLRTRKVPEYMKHPEKWVYYSLSDVTADQMSDATNAATAQTFLREMEEKEASNEDNKNEDDFIFKKPTFYISSAYKKVCKKPDPEPVEVKFEKNKIIMPEYVVGVSKKKEKKNNIVREQSSDDNMKKVELKLQHLFDEEEE